MFNLKRSITVVLFSIYSVSSQASLISSGDLTVYDSVQDLTWTKDANLNGQMDWATAVAWANNLDYAGYTDWLLPTINQLTTQFRTNLAEANGSSIAASHNDSYNLFTNVQSYVYWSGSEYAPVPDGALSFDTYNNYQYNSYDIKGRPLYAWAVRLGDVAAVPAVPAVPLPGAVWLFLSGLIGLLSLKRRGHIG